MKQQQTWWQWRAVRRKRGDKGVTEWWCETEKTSEFKIEIGGWSCMMWRWGGAEVRGAHNLLETGHHRSMGFELIVPVREKRRECRHLRKWHRGWSSSATSNEMRTCRCHPNRSTNRPHLVWMRAQGGLGSGVRGNELSIWDKEVGTRSLS